MRVFLTGANGFIGGHLVGALMAADHDVIGAVRNASAFQRRFPMAGAIRVDMNTDVTPAVWIPRLAAFDAVVNCAGILTGGRGQSMDAIHHRAPAALFDACVAANVRRVIQISAISAEPGAGTDYAETKQRADDHIAGLDLDWVVLRPSLVYARSSFGGTTLMRALATLPFAVPVISEGDQVFQPIHMDDLSRTVVTVLGDPGITRRVIDPVGPETLTLRQILLKLRSWLGLAPAPVVRVPEPLVVAVCRLGDVLAAVPMNTTALKQIRFGNVGSPEAFAATTGLSPMTMDVALARDPAGAQERWHARLYVLRPVLRLTLAMFWIGTGILTLIDPLAVTVPLAVQAGVPSAMAVPILWAGGLVDIGLGTLLLMGWRVRAVCCAMLAVTAGYLTYLSAGLPWLWADPLGPLTKAVVVMAATLVLMAIAEDR